MASVEVLNDLLLSPPLFDRPRGNVKSRGLAIEKKIEYLEDLYGKVSNRRSRRWINDRLLMELVPRLDAEEIRGLFAPPPWATMIQALEGSSIKRKGCTSAEKLAVLTAWHKVDCRTREALRRSFLSSLVNDYEGRVRAFISDCAEGDALVLRVQDPFSRLLLHGICEFYNLVSVTNSEYNISESSKMTTIKKKKGSSVEMPNITLCQFLRMAKQGVW